MRIFQPDRFLLASFVKQNAHLLTGQVLDVGGQDGKRYGRDLTQAGKHTTLDPDARFHPDIVAGAEAIPLPDASVDSLLCMEVLMDVYPIQPAVAEMARVLKPGGYLVASTSFMGPLYNEAYHYWRFTPASLRTLLEPYFEDIRIENRGGFRTQRAQNWIRYHIERYGLYDHRILGNLYSVWSQWRGMRAIRADAQDRSAANRKYAVGFNIVARRQSS